MRYFLRKIILVLSFALLPLQAMGQHTVDFHKMSVSPALFASDSKAPKPMNCCDTAVPNKAPSSCLPFGLPSDFEIECPSTENVVTYASRVDGYTPVLLELETPPPVL